MELYNRLIKKNYVITVKNDKIRQDTVKKQFDRIGIKFEFFENILYLNRIMTDNEISNLSKNDKGFYGRVGCNLAHYDCLLQIANNKKIKDNEYVAIFEDDVAFPDKEIFHRTFETGIKDLVKDNKLQIMYLGSDLYYFEDDLENKISAEVINEQITEHYKELIDCAHAIIYKKSIIKDIVKNYRENLLKYFIIPAHLRQPTNIKEEREGMYDTFLPRYLINHDIPLYTFYPPIARQECVTYSYNFPNRNWNISCRIKDNILKNIKNYEKLKKYDQIWLNIEEKWKHTIE